MGLFKPYLLIPLILFGYNFQRTELTCETRHVVKVLHPGISRSDPIRKTLVQSKCNPEEPVFYMDVESVVCGDAQCRIDTVRIIWNELGFYKRIELANGISLEKAKGAPFTQTDYQKLDNILSNAESGLKNIYKEDVTGSETSEGVDALSGATIALDGDAYVKGAVWTCYTLWHWVNGDITKTIRDLTGDGLSVDSLQSYLKERTFNYRVFAVEQLSRRKIHDSKTVKAILQVAPVENYALQKLIVGYLEKLPDIPYLEAIERLLKIDNEKLSLLALRSLSVSDRQIPIPYYDRLGKLTLGGDSYQTIDLYLKLLNNEKIVSNAVSAEIVRLLDNQDFLIARRAYWFLSKQKLTEINKVKCSSFYEKNSNRL